jgi:hypothetical protein
VQRFAPALGAFRRPARPKSRHRDRTSFDTQRLPLENRLGDFPARRIQYPAERRPRNTHPFPRRVVIQPLEIRQAQRLRFIEHQAKLLQGAAGYPGGLEECALGQTPDSAAVGSTRHGNGLVRLSLAPISGVDRTR